MHTNTYKLQNAIKVTMETEDWCVQLHMYTLYVTVVLWKPWLCLTQGLRPYNSYTMAARDFADIYSLWPKDCLRI